MIVVGILNLEEGVIEVVTVRMGAEMMAAVTLGMEVVMMGVVSGPEVGMMVVVMMEVVIHPKVGLMEVVMMMLVKVTAASLQHLANLMLRAIGYYLPFDAEVIPTKIFSLTVPEKPHRSTK